MPESEIPLNHRLASYFHDCLAAQTDWASSVNVLDQKDVALLPLSADEQQSLGSTRHLSLDDDEAIELAKRAALQGDNASLTLGALFLVGRIRSKETQKYKPLCAPLLEVPLHSKPMGDAQGISVRAAETEFTVNYSLLAELLQGEEDDLQDRLADLSEFVPDFPVDEDEFDNFWQRFRMIAPEVPLVSDLPKPRKKQAARIKPPQRQTQAEQIRELEHKTDLIDFYIPQSAKDDDFRLLPATAILLGKKTGHAMSALSELRAMQSMPLEKTAFGCLFDPATSVPSEYQPHERPFPDEIHPLPLTPAQSAIIESARSSPLTVVTGPPGTGKSYTIAAIMLDAMLNGQTVLLASQMEKAVEVVTNSVEERAGPLAIARTGGRATQRALSSKIKKITGPKNNLGETVDSSVQDCGARHYELTQQLQQLEQGFQNAIEAEQQWSEMHRDCERSEPLLPFPVQDLDSKLVRKARKLFQRSIESRAANRGFLRKWWGKWNHHRVRKLLQIPGDPSNATENDVKSMMQFYCLRADFQDFEARLKHPFLADIIWEQTCDTERDRHRCALELLRLMRKRRMRTLVSNQHHRAALRDLGKLLRRRNRELKSELKKNIAAHLLTDAFPGWASTTRSLCEVLPATPALFDVVVIDEASQCDLALASVALMRGKRAVVVGDPNQLRHVCFLSRTREQAYCVRNELSSDEQRQFHYRRSLFDVAADAVEQRNFYMLDEHFRSHPHIISFSNRAFYDGELKIMTGRPSDGGQVAITVNQVSGVREPDSSVNPAEIDKVIELVGQQIEQNREGPAVSIGIVSPFRDHADQLQRRIIDNFSSEVISRHGLVVGTAHSLQGDEKDIILFTTSIDCDAHRSSLHFLETPNLFNVAITRARHQLFVVTSMEPTDLPSGLLRDFLMHAQTPWAGSRFGSDEPTDMEEEFSRHLQDDRMNVWMSLQTAGTEVPIVAGKGDKRLAIMCDQYSHVDTPSWKHLEMQQRLRRAGWEISRISHRSLTRDPAAATRHARNCLKGARLS